MGNPREDAKGFCTMVRIKNFSFIHFSRIRIHAFFQAFQTFLPLKRFIKSDFSNKSYDHCVVSSQQWWSVSDQFWPFSKDVIKMGRTKIILIIIIGTWQQEILVKTRWRWNSVDDDAAQIKSRSAQLLPPNFDNNARVGQLLTWLSAIKTLRSTDDFDIYLFDFQPWSYFWSSLWQPS